MDLYPFQRLNLGRSPHKKRALNLSYPISAFITHQLIAIFPMQSHQRATNTVPLFPTAPRIGIVSIIYCHWLDGSGAEFSFDVI
jgi:hypothetical protein